MFCKFLWHNYSIFACKQTKIEHFFLVQFSSDFWKNLSNIRPDFESIDLEFSLGPILSKFLDVIWFNVVQYVAFNLELKHVQGKTSFIFVPF